MNIQITIAIIGAVTAISGAFFTANASVATLNQRENDHYAQLQQQLSDLKNTMNDKFDIIIKKSVSVKSGEGTASN